MDPEPKKKPLKSLLRIPIKRINLLGIYQLYYTNRKAVKYIINLSKLESYFTVTNLNI